MSNATTLTGPLLVQVRHMASDTIYYTPASDWANSKSTDALDCYSSPNSLKNPRLLLRTSLTRNASGTFVGRIPCNSPRVAVKSELGNTYWVEKSDLSEGKRTYIHAYKTKDAKIPHCQVGRNQLTLVDSPRVEVQYCSRAIYWVDKSALSEDKERFIAIYPSEDAEHHVGTVDRARITLVDPQVPSQTNETVSDMSTKVKPPLTEQNEFMFDHKVLEWAEDLNLIAGGNAPMQFIKLIEELGEVASAIARGETDKVKDGIGDMDVVLTIFAKMMGLTRKECRIQAYNEIKDREGKMRGGVFVKKEDL